MDHLCSIKGTTIRRTFLHTPTATVVPRHVRTAKTKRCSPTTGRTSYIPFRSRTTYSSNPCPHQRAVSWRAALHVRRQQHRVQEHPRVRCPVVAVAVTIAAAAASDDVARATAARDPLRCLLRQVDATSLVTGARERREARVFAERGVAKESWPHGSTSGSPLVIRSLFRLLIMCFRGRK